MKSIKQRLNKAFREYIRKRDPVCLFAGKRDDCLGSPTECAHVMSGRHDGTQWLPQNAVGLCRVCHAHQHQDEPRLLEDWFIGEYGPLVWEALRRLHNKPSFAPKSELEDHLRYLKEATDAL